MKVSINAKSIEQLVNAETAHIDARRGPGAPSLAAPRPDIPPVPDPAPSPTAPLQSGGMTPVRDRLFVSYCRQDIEWVRRLQTMMTPLLRDSVVDLWWDGRIRPGERWRAEIDAALASTKVALFLVSPDLLGSDFIMTQELPYLLDAADRGEIVVTWILLRSCLHDRIRINEFQALHDVRTPLGALGPAAIDGALAAICRQLETIHR